jgi:hypothetical protein
MSEHGFIVSPSVFVETPGKQANATHDAILGDLSCTQVSTPNSTTSTPHYMQPQEENYNLREPIPENNNLNIEEEPNENPMNTLAAISESRLSFQMKQSSVGTSYPPQNTAQESSSGGVKSSIHNEESVRKSGSKRWLFGTNQSICALSEKGGKKPRPRGYVVNDNDMPLMETQSTHSKAAAKTEPLSVDLEARRNSERNFMSNNFPMRNISSFPMANANVDSSLRQSAVMEDNSKFPVASSYFNRDYSSLPTKRIVYHMEGGASSANALRGHYFGRSWNESFEDTTSSLDKSALNSLPAETPSQRRERRKLARAQVRAANQLWKRQAMQKLKTKEQQSAVKVETAQSSAVASPSEEPSYASSRQEDALREDAKDSLDPKVIRAIRNREAALRSRQQAKARLKALESENAEFQQRVNLLERENMELRQELEKFKALLQEKNFPSEHTESGVEQPNKFHK